MDEKLLQELAERTEDLKRCTTRSDAARREETAAINALNDVQKRVDAALSSMKLKAPRGSDWHESARRPPSIERAA